MRFEANAPTHERNSSRDLHYYLAYWPRPITYPLGVAYQKLEALWCGDARLLFRSLGTADCDGACQLRGARRS